MPHVPFSWKLLSFLRRPEGVELLFFGLGNPGAQYAATRHNIGFRIIDAVGGRLGQRKQHSLWAATCIEGTLFEEKKKVLAIKPATFMNRSGQSVERYVREIRRPLSDILVIVDDYHLPLGKVRARRRGSDGGHNGLKSIIGCIGDDFPRLRVGIGPAPQDTPTIDFVLGPFSPVEEEKLATTIPLAAEACLLFARSGIEAVMNEFNS